MYLKTEHEASASNVLTKAIPGFSKIFFPCIEQNRWLRQCQARDLCACFSNRPSELVGGGGERGMDGWVGCTSTKLAWETCFKSFVTFLSFIYFSMIHKLHCVTEAY